MKRTMSLLILLFLFRLMLLGSAAAAEEKEGPFVIHDIALDPQDPQIIYGATSNYGVLKSTDGGTTWALSNRGLRSYTHHAIVIDPLHPHTLYLGAWGEGVSKSVDQGAHWVEANAGLGNTAIEALVLHPVNPEQIYVATTSGIFKSPDGGASWIPSSQGLPIPKIEIFRCLLILPTGPIELLLGTSQGLFKRERGASSWEAVNGIAAKEHITVLVSLPKTHFLYAGTVKDGLLQSQDGGNTWTPLGEKMMKVWVSDIAIDPHDPDVIYVSTRGNGILKSHDAGNTWQEVNKGLPVKDIRSLAINPRTPETLYAGTTHQGLLKTINGGRDWVHLTGYPALTITEILASLSGSDRSRRNSSSVSVPPEFFKCNQCHGWGDALLNSKKTYWRVPPNKRDWGPTINRMSLRAKLAPEESAKILKFLMAYTHSSESSEIQHRQ
jgi:photosystem II stability/assembly factor-like uncharacterized protein